MNIILQKIIKFNTLTIIGVHRNDEAETFYVLKIQKRKSKIEILSNNTFLDFKSLKESIETKTPIIFVIDGKGVLNKKIDLKNELDIEWVKKLDYKTIHFTSFDTNNFQFFSFCRKTVSNDLIELFQKNGYQIIDFYIGPLISVLLNSTLKKNKLFSNESILDYENDELTEITKSTNPKEIINYDFGNKKISKFHLPLYASAIHFFVNQKTISKSESELINKEEVFYKKAFSTFGTGILIGFFILLLSSYVLIQYLNSKNTQLNLETVYSNQSYELIKKLEDQRLKKLEIVNKTGIGSAKFISYYGYEIAKSTPPGVSLSEINIFPILNEIKNTNGVVFNSKNITIKGYTKNENIFNNWLSLLKDFKWIKNLEIVSIKKDKKNITFFELNLILKNV